MNTLSSIISQSSVETTLTHANSNRKKRTVLSIILSFQVHIPRGLAFSTLLYGFCGILCSMPFFLQDKSVYDLDVEAQDNPGNVTMSTAKVPVPLCFNSSGNS